MSLGVSINLIIIFFLIISIYRGWKIGWLRQFFSAIGFFSGLFIGAAMEPWLVHFGHSTFTRTMLTLLSTLGTAAILMIIGEIFGNYLKNNIHFKNLNLIDDFFGSIISFITSLITIWLAATVIGALNISSLQPAIDNSFVISTLNHILPKAPVILSDLGSIIDPNGFPKVFIGNEPIPNNSLQLPQLTAFQNAVNNDQNSVVKIEGLGCGGMVEGSGFIVAKNLVATNAHVIAGIKQVDVIDPNGTHSAEPVLFNPNLDFAVLRVNNLYGKPLNLDQNILNSGTPEAVIGYPGGGPLSVKPAVIMEEIDALGRNIYGQGQTTRSVYELKADVIPGNSGGPLIEENGDVSGVVFAQSTTYNQVGYALTANQISQPINQAKNNPNPVSTSSCAE